MFTDKPVVFITDTDLGHCRLKYCRLSMISVQYGIIVAIILKMIVVWNTEHVFIITQRIDTIWKRAHPGLVILLESFLA